MQKAPASDQEPATTFASQFPLSPEDQQDYIVRFELTLEVVVAIALTGGSGRSGGSRGRGSARCIIQHLVLHSSQAETSPPTAEYRE